MTEEHDDQDAVDSEEDDDQDAVDSEEDDDQDAVDSEEPEPPVPARKKVSKDDGEAFYPGNVVNMSVANKADPAHPSKPYLVTAEYAHQGWTRRFATRGEAEAFIEETQTEEERNHKESDKSLWD